MSTHRPEWHAEENELVRYLSGHAPRAATASIEAHLLDCAECRSALGAIADDAERQAGWDRLAATIDRPSSRIVGRLSRGRGLVWATVATPAMLQAALVAVFLVGVVPLVAALTVRDAGLVALLLVAPLAPGAAVAIAYRESADPVGEMSLATPAAGLRLVAMRALVVSLVALPLALAVLLAVDTWVGDVPMRLGVVWCLPGLALAALVLLAGTTRLDPVQVAAGLSTVWVSCVIAVVTAHRALRPEVFVDLLATPGAQGTALAVALSALLLTAVRSDAARLWRIP